MSKVFESNFLILISLPFFSFPLPILWARQRNNKQVIQRIKLENKNNSQ